MSFFEFYLSKYTLAEAANVGVAGMLVIDIVLVAVLLIRALSAGEYDGLHDPSSMEI